MNIKKGNVIETEFGDTMVLDVKDNSKTRRNFRFY